MSSKFYLSETAWTELAIGDCVVSARGHARIAFAATQPALDDPAHTLNSVSGPLDYAGPDKAWGLAMEPGVFVVVSGGNVQASNTAPPTAAPVVTVQPSITPATPNAGDTVVVDLGAATGTPAPEAEAELINDGQRVALDNPPVVMRRPGAWSLVVKWRNSVAPVAIAALTGVVLSAAAAQPGNGPNSWLATVDEFTMDHVPFGSGAPRALDFNGVSAAAGKGAATSAPNDPANGLPAGATIVGTEIRITGDDVDMSAGYDLTGYTVLVTGNNCNLDNSYSDDTDGTAALGDKIVFDGCDGFSVRHSTLNGGGDMRATVGGGIRLKNFASNGTISDNVVTGFPSDAIVGTFGDGLRLERNHVTATTSLPFTVTLITDETAPPAGLDTGDYAYCAQTGFDGIWISQVDANTNALPATGQSNAFWLWFGPRLHLDLVSLRQSMWSTVMPLISENHFEFVDRNLLNGTRIGGNEVVRGLPNTAGQQFMSFMFVRNVLIPEVALNGNDQSSMTINGNGAATSGVPIIANNWFFTDRAAAGTDLNSWIMYWGGNRRVENGKVTGLMDTPTAAQPWVDEANNAVVPLSGTTDALDGTIIEARAASIDDGGATSTAWVEVGAAAGGAWSGSINVPRSTSYYSAEVRVKDSDAPVAQMNKRFSVGHTQASFEQSNKARIFNPAYSQTPVPPVTDPDALQVFQVDRNSGVVTRTRVTDATPISAAVVRISNVYAAERPGEKFAIVAHVQSGTSPFEMIDDTDPDRVWAHEQALADAFSADGATMDTVLDEGWIAWSPKADNEDRIIPILTQKLADGTPLNIGDTVSGAWGSYVLSHSVPQLYPDARIGFVGPHGRAITATKSDYEDPGDLDYMGMRDDWAAVLSDSANFPEFLPYVMETVGGIRGVDDGNGGWTDEAHHSATDPDGLERLAATQALVALKTIGVANWPVPAFDSVYYEPGGAYADFWMDGQDITTLRDLRNGAGSSAYVRGWTLNGVPLTTEAQIVGDAGGSGFAGVRITPGGALTYGSNIQFGRGQLPGFLNYPGDYQAGYHQDLPVVDLGQGGLDAMTMKTRSTEGLVNTLPAPAQFTTRTNGTAAGTGPYFVDDTGAHDFGPGVTSLRTEFTGSITDTNGGSYLLATGGGVIALELLASGLIRSSGGGGSGIPLATTATPITLGTTYTWTIILDLVAGTFTVDQDDGATVNRVIDAALSGQPAEIASGRYPVFLRLNGSGQEASQVLGSFSSIRMWRNDTAGAGAAWIDISGDAAAVNVHALKQGADAI